MIKAAVNKTAYDIKYDVFVSYSREDAPEVKLLARLLKQKGGLRVWLDEDRLRPGFSWRSEIQTAMRESASALIVWGPKGLGPVQDQERDLALVIRDSRRSDFRVISVFLPRAEPPKEDFAGTDTWLRFESSLDESRIFERLVAAIKGQAPSPEVDVELPDEPAPYRGMADFGIEDARFFFGRSEEIKKMRERLPHSRFLAVLGPSGSGKTSLVKAGFLARLQEGMFPDIPDSRTWRYRLVRPGPYPLRSLTMELARLERETNVSQTSDEHRKRLLNDSGELSFIVQSLLSGEEKLVLTIDRLEELFTLCKDDNERKVFVEALVGLVRHPHEPAWVIVTMRADFYDRVAPYRELANMVVEQQLYLRPMTEEAVAEAISAPARKVGAMFEKGLAEQVRVDAEVRGEVALPLLQHALGLLWRKRRGSWLVWDAYWEIGGVSGALRYHADRVVDGLTEKREVARRLFTSLVWLETGGKMMMAGRRMDKGQLVGQFSDPRMAEQVLQTLADQRLVVLRREQEEDRATAELIHDTLPLHWMRLRQWVENDQEFLLWRQRLKAAFDEWVHAEHDAGALLHGAALSEAEDWKEKREDELNADERDYIERSIKRRDREATRRSAELQRRMKALSDAKEAAEARERTQRWLSRFLLIFTLGVSLALATTFYLFVQAEHQRLAAQAGRLTAQAESVLNQAPDLLPHSVMLAAEAMNIEGNLGPSWLPRFMLLPVEAAERWLFGEIRLVEARQVLRTGLALLPRPGAVLDKEAWVEDIAYSPDGAQIAAVHGTEVQLSRVEGGEAVPFRLLSHEKSVSAIAFSPDGAWLAAVSRTEVWLWRIEKEEETVPRRLPHEKPVSAVAFSPDGAWLAAASGAEVWLWQFDDGEETVLRRLAHEERVSAVAFGPAGILAAASGDRVRIWNVSGKELRPPLQGHRGGVDSLAFSPEGEYLATGSADRTARVWQWESGREVTRMQHGDVRRIVAITGEVENIPAGRVQAVAFSPDGKRLATASSDWTARIWEILYQGNNNRELMRAVHETMVNAIAFSPDGRHFATASARGSRLWEASRGGEITRIAHDYSVTTLAFSPDGSRLATITSGGANRVSVWKIGGIRTSDKEVVLDHPSAVLHMAFGPDGTLPTTLGSDNVVRRWSSATSASEIRLGAYGDESVPIAMSPDAVYLATAGRDFTIQVRQTSDGEEVASLPLREGEITAVAFSPNRRYLATVSGAVARVWELANGKITEHTSIEHESGINRVVFSPDSRYLATAGDDFTARVWDMSNGKRIASLSGHATRHVSAIAFSQNGEYLGTAAGSTAYVWKISDSGELARIPHDYGINAVAFRPGDADHLATAGLDGAVRILYWRTEDLIDDACKRLTRNLTGEEWNSYLGTDTPYRKICEDLP